MKATEARKVMEVSERSGIRVHFSGLAFLACFALVVSSAAFGGAEESKAKDALKKVTEMHAASVVWIKYTMKAGGMMAMMGGGRGGQQTITALGTVLSDDGVIVAEQSMMGVLMNAVMAQMGEGEGAPREDPAPEQIKIMMPNGKEVEADFVATDKDYGLLFVKARKASLDREGVKLKALAFPAAAPKLEVGDRLVGIARWSQKFGSSPRVVSLGVDSVVTKPIKAYGGAGTLGDVIPLFTEKGEAVGFAVTYLAGLEISMDMMATGKSLEKMIVPIENLKPLFDQAKAAQPKANAAPADDEE